VNKTRSSATANIARVGGHCRLRPLKVTDFYTNRRLKVHMRLPISD